MLSVPTSEYAYCQCCNASFQRLSSHLLSWNEFCGNDDDAFAMSDRDDSFPCNKESDDDSEDEDVPDGIIMDL
jgi:hypothetical protein